MINFSNVDNVRQKVDFLKKQIDMMIGWIPKCDLVISPSADPEVEKAKIVEHLQDHKSKINGVYDEVRELESKEDVDSIPIDEQIKKLTTVDELLRTLRKEVDVIVHTHYTARLDPYMREISRAIDDVYGDFKFVIPNVRYEVEVLENHFRVPGNAEKSIMPELEDILQNLEKHQISMSEFMNGYTFKNKAKRGYKELRTVDSVFSQFQFYENMVDDYADINASVYNLCKILDPFFREHRHEEDFIEFANQFADINSRTIATKSIARKRKNIISMPDIFDIYVVFSKIIKKMGVKYSFREEYSKGDEELKVFEGYIEDLVKYDMDQFEKVEKAIFSTAKDESEKTMITAAMTEVREFMKKKRLPFKRIEEIFKKLKNKDFNIVVMEREMDEMTIHITPHLTDKYGDGMLKRMNMIIEEVDFWLYGDEKQAKFGLISPLTEKMQKGEDMDISELEEKINAFDDEMRERFRKLYPVYITELGTVAAALEKLLGSKQGRRELDRRLVEKDAWKGYAPRLLSAKKSILIANGFLKKLDEVKINLFPFIKLAGLELALMLYELSMRLFMLYERADRKSVANMMNIQLLYRDFRTVKSLWHSFSLFFKTGNASNFDVLEERIISIPKNELIKAELDAMFRTSEPVE